MSNIEPCDCTCCARWLVKFLGRHAGIEGYDAFRILEEEIFEMNSLLEKQRSEIRRLNLIIQESESPNPNIPFQEIRTESPDCDDPE